MTGSPQSAEAQERLDELRRRLYRDGATAEDLRRFTEQQALMTGEQPSSGDPSPTAQRRRPLLLAPAAIAGTAAVVVVGVVIGLRPDSRGSALPSVAPADAGLVVEDIGDGRTMLTQRHPVSEPVAVASSIDGQAAVGERFEGVGDAVVQLHADDASFHGGRVLVSLSFPGPAPLAWRAIRRASRMDWSSYWEVVARGTVPSRGEVPAPTVFSYRLAPPTRLAVQAPEGVRWTLQVAFAGTPSPDLH